MLGCFERGLFPGVSRAVRTLLPEIAVPAHAGLLRGAARAQRRVRAGRELARRLGEELPGVDRDHGRWAAPRTWPTVLGRDRVHELCEHLAAGRGEPRSAS